MTEPTSLSPELGLCAHLVPRVGLSQGYEYCVPLLGDLCCLGQSSFHPGVPIKKHKMSPQRCQYRSGPRYHSCWPQKLGDTPSQSLGLRPADSARPPECNCRNLPDGRFAGSLAAKGPYFCGPQVQPSLAESCELPWRGLLTVRLFSKDPEPLSLSSINIHSGRTGVGESYPKGPALAAVRTCVTFSGQNSHSRSQT